MEPELTEAIDRFRSEDEAVATQSEAIRRILRDWLIGNGYLVDKAG